MEKLGANHYSYQHLGKHQTGFDRDYFWDCNAQRHWRICRKSLVLPQKRSRKDCASQCCLQRDPSRLCFNIWSNRHTVCQYFTSIYTKNLYLLFLWRIDCGCGTVIFNKEHSYQRIFFTNTAPLSKGNQIVGSQKEHFVGFFTLYCFGTSILFVVSIF